jgi:hypothetical protein
MVNLGKEVTENTRAMEETLRNLHLEGSVPQEIKKKRKPCFTVGFNCKVYKGFTARSFWYPTRDISQDPGSKTITTKKKKYNRNKGSFV